MELKVSLVVATSAGGVGSHVHSLAGGFGARGIEVTVHGPASVERLFGFEAVGARFVALDIADRPHPVADLSAAIEIRRQTRSATVVHAHGLRAGGLASLGLAHGKRSPPLVVTVHNAMVGGWSTRIAYAVLERMVVREARTILAVSADLAERMRCLGARSVGMALVPAPDRGTPGSAAQVKVRTELDALDRPLVLVVGRLAEQKGLTTLLDASAGWASRLPPPVVAIVGDGPLHTRLQARIDKEQLPVRLLGRRSDVAELLVSADVVVVPSEWEGQPLIVQEALRAGRPLVATMVGGVPGIVGAAALLVPPRNAVELEAAVLAVLDDADLANRLSEAAMEQATRLSTVDDAVAHLTAVYAQAAMTN